LLYEGNSILLLLYIRIKPSDKENKMKGEKKGRKTSKKKRLAMLICMAEVPFSDSKIGGTE